MLLDGAREDEEGNRIIKKGAAFTSMHVAGAAKRAKKAQQQTARSREDVPNEHDCVYGDEGACA